MIESAARRLASELVDRRESINRELSRNGVRFGIYKNGEYHDRLFPYDPIPRIIESDEFDRMEAGLKQRVNALNAYLRDIYSDFSVMNAFGKADDTLSVAAKSIAEIINIHFINYTLIYKNTDCNNTTNMYCQKYLSMLQHVQPDHYIYESEFENPGNQFPLPYCDMIYKD